MELEKGIGIALVPNALVLANFCQFQLVLLLALMVMKSELFNDSSP